LIILIFLIANVLNSEINISGVNEIKFVNSNRIIENMNYISEKLQLQAQFSSFRAGIKYDLYKPKFDKFALINDDMDNATIEAILSAEEDENYFDEYYLQYESDFWFAQVGTYEAVIGSGMILHNFYDDDFESSAAGDYIAEQNPEWWTTWTNAPGTGEDAIISDDYAHSGSNSVLVDEVDGATDLIYKLGDKTAGIYDVSFWMYVETGYAGYYNFQHFELPGNEWAIEVYLNTDGTADVHAGGTNSATFNYDHDTWIKFEHNINLTDDWAEFYVAGNLIPE